MSVLIILPNPPHSTQSNPLCLKVRTVESRFLFRVFKSFHLTHPRIRACMCIAICSIITLATYFTTIQTAPTPGVVIAPHQPTCRHLQTRHLVLSYMASIPDSTECSDFMFCIFGKVKTDKRQELLRIQRFLYSGRADQWVWSISPSLCL